MGTAKPVYKLASSKPARRGQVSVRAVAAPPKLDTRKSEAVSTSAKQKSDTLYIIGLKALEHPPSSMGSATKRACLWWWRALACF